ncbi:hypothetical protein BKA70DRAFT_1559822 [Coprinopsis sp. MPI-PUGE-AT-0042]|nr:hypothetical protein BKA70DRAFT_1559822 [Coprinopsis sp. MPI-PUGE-AT-0042]
MEASMTGSTSTGMLPLLIELPPPSLPLLLLANVTPLSTFRLRSTLVSPGLFEKLEACSNDWSLATSHLNLSLGSLSGNTLTVNLSYQNRSVSFQVTIAYPEGSIRAIRSIRRRYLLLLRHALSSTMSIRKVGEAYRSRDTIRLHRQATFNHQQIAVGQWTSSRADGIDASKLGVTGCSNSGKAALVAGAFDQRISLTVPVETGTGGAGCYRIGGRKLLVTELESSQLETSQGTTPLFSSAFTPYAGDIRTLPLDHQSSLCYVPLARPLLRCGVALRAPPKSLVPLASKIVLVFQSSDSMTTAKFPPQQYPELFAFVNKFLRGNVNEPTSYMKTDVPNNGGFEEVRWVDWIVPELVPGTNPPPTSGTCQAPSNLALTSNSRFPNPFSFAGASKQVSTSEIGSAARNELADLFQRYEIGPIPARPSSVSGSFSGSTLTVNVSETGKASPSRRTSLTLLAHLVLFLESSQLAALTVPNPAGSLSSSLIIVKLRESTRGSGLFYQLYPNHAAGSLGATAWAIGGYRCSDNGKAALVAGAFDQRIVLTIPVESGTGGAGCLRVADDLYKSGVGIVTAANLAGGALFSSTFSQYANQGCSTPIRHHLLAALVAPRGLLVLDNSQFAWLGPSSVYGCKIYRSLGYADRLGISIVGGHDHCVFAGQQYPEFNAFINKFLRNNLQENTTVSKIDLSNNGGYDEAKYVDWSVPTLAS